MADENVTTQESTEQEPQGAEQVDWEAKYKEAVAQSRKWESRAKANSDKAAKWDEYEQQGMSEAEKLTKRAESAEAELAQLKADAQRRADAHEVAEANGVPEHLLSFCADREAMEAFAKEYAAQAHVPAAPSAAPSRVIRGGEGKQSTRDKFASYFE